MILETKKDIRQFKKWMKALRSGKYHQTEGTLQNVNGFCCLGVACKVLIPEDKQLKDEHGLLCGMLSYEQKYSPEWLVNLVVNFKNQTDERVTELNDDGDFNFDEIADVLEAVYIHKVLE